MFIFFIVVLLILLIIILLDISVDTNRETGDILIWYTFRKERKYITIRNFN